MALGSEEDVFSAGGVSFVVADADVVSGGKVVRDIRYWKPWQPPLSTVIRKARLELESLAIISFRRFDARGVISMVISFPSSSFLGLTIATVPLLDGAEENVLGVFVVLGDVMKDVQP